MEDKKYLIRETEEKKLLRSDELVELKNRIQNCKNMQEAQMFQLPFTNGESEIYMVGLYNGMELVNAIIEGRRPEFYGILPKEPEREQVGLPEGENIEPARAISGIVKE